MPLDIVWFSGPNPAVLVVTFVFCLLGTLAFALGPALKLSRRAVVGDLKQQAGEDVVRRRWKFLPRHPLVVVQIAFSLALLTAAALFIRGANKAAAVDTGLNQARAFFLKSTPVSPVTNRNAQKILSQLDARLAALPGVEHVSVSRPFRSE